MKKNPSRLVVLLLIGIVLMAGISILVGSVPLGLNSIRHIFLSRIKGLEIPAHLTGMDTIIFVLRIPRTILMLLTGAALACSGASYQGLFRNPLADPYLIGVSTGAGLGAVIAMSINWPYSSLSTLMTPMFAFGAAILTVIIVFRLGRINGFASTTGLILAGVAVNAFASSLTSVWMLISSRELRSSLSWMLGGMVATGWDQIKIVTPLIFLGLAGQYLFSHQLNVLQFGDEQAANLGVSVKKVRLWVILFSTLTTAAAISFSGIIGFIGLIVPHVIRILIGGDYRKLLPISMLGGAFFLLFADILSRVILAPQELPVGIITAMIGAPFFLWLLNKTKRQGIV